MASSEPLLGVAELSPASSVAVPSESSPQTGSLALNPRGREFRVEHRDRLLGRLKWDKAPFDAFIFEGGGTKGMVYAGVVKRLEKAKLQENVKNFAGTSAGSQTATLLAVGYTSHELQQIMRDAPWSCLLDSTSCCKQWWCPAPQNIWRLLRGFGWCKGDFLAQYLEKLVKEKMQVDNCTFKQLYEKRGVVLKVGVCNLLERKFEMLSYENAPDMPIALAARASSSIPFIFQPVHYNGAIYVDGGVAGNLPLAFPKMRSLAVNLVTKSEWTEAETRQRPPIKFIHFLTDLIETVLSAAQASGTHAQESLDSDKVIAQLAETDQVFILKVDCEHHGVLETDLSDHDIRSMVAAGWDAADYFLS